MSDSIVDTVSFGLLYPSLLYVAPDRGTQWLDFFLAHAASDLAFRTRVLRHTYTQDAQAGVRDYPIEVPEGYTLAYVERVCVGGQVYTPSRDVPCRQQDGQNACGLSAHCSYQSMTTPFQYNVTADAQQVTIDLPTAVDIEGGVDIEVSYAPKRDGCEMPKLLYDRYSSAIVSLALNEILLDPTLKVNPRTLRIVNQRSVDLLRRAKQDGDSENAAGTTRIDPRVGEFLI